MYGFVTFKEEETALEVLGTRHELWDKAVAHQIQLSRAKRLTKKETETAKAVEGPNGDTRKLFIGGVPGLTTLSEFKKYFSRFGDLEDIMLPTKSSESKLNCGFGFVTYRHSKDALAVLQSKDQHSFRAKLVR